MEKNYVVFRANNGKIEAYTTIAETHERAVELTKFDLAFALEHDGGYDETVYQSIWENLYWAVEVEFTHGATRNIGLEFNNL